jgi:hypothetical protein
MKRNVILLIDADVDTSAAAITASEDANFDVRFAKIDRDFPKIVTLRLEDIAAVVLDYDPHVHDPASVEILERWLPARPLIFVSKSEDLRHPLVLAGGTTKHLIKPVTGHSLAHAIATILHQPDCRCLSCDQWGHPRTEHANKYEPVPASS